MNVLKVVALSLFIIVLAKDLWQSHQRAKVDHRVNAVKDLNRSMNRVIDIYESESALIADEQATSIENVYENEGF